MEIAFVDCETTGLDVRRHHAWEVAAIVRGPGIGDVEYVWQVRPDLTTADPEALRIGRFNGRFAVPDGWDAVCLENGQRTMRLTMPEFLYDLQETLQGTVLVGSNPAFDDRFLTKLLQDHGRKIPWHYRTIDVATLAAGRLAATQPGHPALALPWRSYDLSEAIGVPRPAKGDAHTALGDARWAKDVFDAATGGAK